MSRASSAPACVHDRVPPGPSQQPYQRLANFLVQKQSYTTYARTVVYLICYSVLTHNKIHKIDAAGVNITKLAFIAAPTRQEAKAL